MMKQILIHSITICHGSWAMTQGPWPMLECDQWPPLPPVHNIRRVEKKRRIIIIIIIQLLNDLYEKCLCPATGIPLIPISTIEFSFQIHILRMEKYGKIPNRCPTGVCMFSFISIRKIEIGFTFGIGISGYCVCV